MIVFPTYSMKKALILSAALLLADSPQEKVEIPNLPPAPITTVRTQEAIGLPVHSLPPQLLKPYDINSMLI